MSLRRSHIAYVVLFLMPFAVQLQLARRSNDADPIGSPGLLFGVVVIAAGLCVVASVAVLWRAFATDAAELAWVGLFFFCASMLPFVHGLTTPGVIYGANSATTNAVLLAIPLAVVSASPTMASRYGRLARSWKPWTIGWLVSVTILSITMLWLPDLVPAPDPESTFGMLVTLLTVTGGLMLGWRHVRFAEIADRRAPLAVTVGFSLTIGAIAGQYGAAAYSGAFWLAHALDITGVLAATMAAVMIYRRSSSMSDVLAPIVAVEPRAALEVGLHPAVIAFVEDLDAKDPLTRDHVIRVAELAMEVAELMRLPAQELRRAGLVGALHDIGKIRVPDEILNKPGALNELEWNIMRSHAAAGGDIVSGCEPLADLAASVRAHHERIDGGGYPDGLAGDDIPLIARIVSVCDAFDAMAYTRRYRSGMELEEVVEILREHAGTQWDPFVVQAVITVVSKRTNWEPQLLTRGTVETCDCLPSALVTPGREAVGNKAPREMANVGAFTQHQPSGTAQVLASTGKLAATSTSVTTPSAAD